VALYGKGILQWLSCGCGRKNKKKMVVVVGGAVMAGMRGVTLGCQ